MDTTRASEIPTLISTAEKPQFKRLGEIWDILARGYQTRLENLQSELIGLDEFEIERIYEGFIGSIEHMQNVMETWQFLWNWRIKDGIRLEFTDVLSQLGELTKDNPGVVELLEVQTAWKTLMTTENLSNQGICQLIMEEPEIASTAKTVGLIFELGEDQYEINPVFGYIKENGLR